MPESRATFLSVVSPHEPRTCGLRRALTSVAASRRMASPASRTVRTCDRISVGDLDALLLDVGEPGLELLEAGRDRREHLLGRLETLLGGACRPTCAAARRPRATAAGTARPSPACRPRSRRPGLLARVPLGQRDGDVGLGPRCGDPGVRELLVDPGELTRVGAASDAWRRPSSTPTPRPAARARIDEQCGGHAGIVTHDHRQNPGAHARQPQDQAVEDLSARLGYLTRAGSCPTDEEGASWRC